MILFSDIVFSIEVLVGLAAFHFHVSEDFAVAEGLGGAGLDGALLDLEAEDSAASMTIMCGRSRNIAQRLKLNLAAIFHQKMSAHIMRGKSWKTSLQQSPYLSQTKAKLSSIQKP